jgi:GH43 family beta-xylosidase
MDPLSELHSQYWAPEVSYWGGKFHLYYSVGDGTEMHIRVALSERPDGPFLDAGLRLTMQDFAIDPHVFEDDDGRRWLFYATDFLTHTHIGTGTVRDRMIDPFTLEGRPSPVVLAQYDWQLFDPAREEKGGVRWHTVEGPTVLKRKGLYYEMFSGGNWQNASYGVGYAISESLDSAGEWKQVCDGTRVLPLLRTTPTVVGPGHNCVVRGPDNRQLYCVYHRWDAAGRRVMAADPMDWIGVDLRVFGPSSTPQPAPNRAKNGLWPAEPSDPSHSNFKVGSGDWSFAQGSGIQREIQGYAEILYTEPVDAGFLLECTAVAERASPNGSAGIVVYDTTGQRYLISISPHGRLEASGCSLKVSTGVASSEKTILQGLPKHVGLFTNDTTAEFRNFSITRGWQDIFDDPATNLADLAFHVVTGTWRVASMALYHEKGRSPGAVFKLVPPGAYEFVANVRLENAPGFYGFFPASPLEKPGPLFAVVEQTRHWMLCMDRSGRGEVGNATVVAALPSFDVYQYQQFGFTVEGTQMSVRCGGNHLCDVPVEDSPQRVGVFASGNASFEMIRVTELTFG